MCANNKVCLLLDVDPHHAGAHHGFLLPPGEVQRKANLKSGGREESWGKVNFHTGTEKEVLPQDLTLPGKACGHRWKGILVEKGQATLGWTNTLN